MEWLYATVTVLSILCSSVVSILYAIIAYKKSKEPPKDEIWEAALKICCSRGNIGADADDFASAYEELTLFKKIGCDRKGDTLSHMKKQENDKKL